MCNCKLCNNTQTHSEIYFLDSREFRAGDLKREGGFSILTPVYFETSLNAFVN